MLSKPPSFMDVMNHVIQSAFPTAEQRNVINELFADFGGDGYNDENPRHQAVVVMASAVVAAPRVNGGSAPIAHFGILRHDPPQALVRHHIDHGYAIGVSGGLLNKIFDQAIELYPGEEDSPTGELWFAFALVSLSLLIEHEYSHITNGHLRLLPAFDSGVGNMYMSHTDADSTSLEKFDLQTLEMDADAAAVSRLVVWALGINSIAADVPLFRPFFVDLASRQELLIRVMKSCIFAIVAIDPEDPDPEHCKAYNHLPRSARIHHVLGTIEGTTLKYFGFSFIEEIGRENISKMIADFLASLEVEPMNQQILGLYCGSEGYLEELFTNWKTEIAPKIDCMTGVVSSDRSVASPR